MPDAQSPSKSAPVLHDRQEDEKSWPQGLGRLLGEPRPSAAAGAPAQPPWAALLGPASATGPDPAVPTPAIRTGPTGTQKLAQAPASGQQAPASGQQAKSGSQVGAAMAARALSTFATDSTPRATPGHLRHQVTRQASQGTTSRSDLEQRTGPGQPEDARGSQDSAPVGDPHNDDILPAKRRKGSFQFRWR
ncbi:MAG: hypothetical protein ACP5VR_02985 [Acidimicrobiales bacterium]